MNKRAMIAALSELLDHDAIVADDESLAPYECDGLSAYRQRPGLVVLPESVEQVQGVTRLCCRHAVPLVARGAGTGLSGGALPIGNGILMSLSRLNRIVQLDPLNRIARVQPGVRNLAISEAARPYDLYYAPDPSSQIACSIGGNVAENAGGVHCLKYGLTVHNVLELTLVTIDGDVVSVGGAGYDGPGFDLLALMTGSEGMLAIVVEIAVRLLPMPESARVLLAAFGSVTEAADAVAAVIAGGVVPAGLEMMDKPAIGAAEAFVHAGYPVDAAAIVLCELDGMRVQVDADVERVEKILSEQGARSVQCSRDETERQKLWAGRKAAFPAVGRIAPDYYCMDGTIPRKRLSEVLAGISALSREFDLPVANVFHAGDGNLHPLILYDANKSGELERVERFGGRILELCVATGGTITGEHGVGVEKIDQMCVQFADAELAQFHAVKAAFDHGGVLNPGKAVPSLRRCAEFGAMHVHRGRLKHPELERF